MFHYYKIFILMGMFAISYGIVSWRNTFDKFGITALRILLSVLAVWAYVLLSRFVIVEVDLALATSVERTQEIMAGDGAKNAVALLFGWVYGIFVTLIVLSATGVWRVSYRWLQKRQEENA